jgi:hypothetical protein
MNLPPSLRPPYLRTKVAQTVHVVCIGWHNPTAVNRWVFETNMFFLAGI